MESERKWSTQQGAIFAWLAACRVVATALRHLVVRARAGTGKTTTILEGVKRVPKTLRVIVCAFNTRIRKELVTRLDKLQAQGECRNVEARTLHSIGLLFLAGAWGRLDSDHSAEVDRDRARDAAGHNAPDEVVTLVVKLASLVKNVLPFAGPEQLADVVALARQFDLEPSDEDAEAGWTVERLARCAGKAADAATERDPKGRISFDDMVFVPLVNGYARPRWDVVIVDEAQDMNAAQLALAQRVVTPGGSIVVVGDDKQAIYGFRGADAGSLDRLKAELSAEELGLTVTYRCGKKIVEVARALVPDFTAYEGNAEGIVDSIATPAIFEQAQVGDFVLSRKNAPLLALALGFIKRGVRARIEGRDIGRMLRSIVAGLKARTVPEYLTKAQKWGEKASKRCARIESPEVREAKLAEVADQVEVLVALAEGAANVSDILLRCDTLFGDDTGEPRKHVVLSSVHKAKGLEADRVFILADTVSTRSVEESNIYYVAVTRAIKHLTWVVGEVKK
jgi:superfamily I DNA/RNA helicase